MKIKVFFPTLFFLFLSQALNAQTPDYLANGSKWRINSLASWGECWTHGKYVVEITGDTTIGVFTYKKMIHHGLNSFMAPFPNPSVICEPEIPFSYPYAFIRQDSLKLYMRDIFGNPDTLLYDFDLQIGDTLPLTFNNSANNITVIGISTLLVGSETRKVFQLSINPIENNFEFLIEGIGHYGGIIGPLSFFEVGEIELVCFSLNDTTYYPSIGAPCDLNVGVDEIASTFKIGIFPNPTNENLTIQTNHPIDINSIDAIDLLGKKVALAFNYKEENQIEVKLNELNNGFYTIRIINTLDQVFTYKVVKE